MLDRTIPFYNMILKCRAYAPGEVSLPRGYSIVGYRPGDEAAWARLEVAAGDFDTPQEAEDYFVSAYLQADEGLRSNIRFLLDDQQQVVGSCIAWQDSRGEEMVPSLHWLVVDEACQGQGLGRALCTDVMNRFAEAGRFPIYLHTQPWSWKAVLLYASLGFCLQRTDTFFRYTNQYREAVETLRTVLSPEQLDRLVDGAED